MYIYVPILLILHYMIWCNTESFFEISSHIQHKDNGHAICYKHIKDSVVKK